MLVHGGATVSVPYWPYIKWGGLLILLALAVRWVYGNGYDACELKHMKAEQSLIDYAAKRGAETDRALADALRKIPHTGQRVNDAVRDHPTSPDCVVPDAAADALQDGIRASEASAAE